PRNRAGATPTSARRRRDRRDRAEGRGSSPQRATLCAPSIPGRKGCAYIVGRPRQTTGEARSRCCIVESWEWQLDESQERELWTWMSPLVAGPAPARPATTETAACLTGPAVGLQLRPFPARSFYGPGKGKIARLKLIRFLVAFRVWARESPI